MVLKSARIIERVFDRRHQGMDWYRVTRAVPVLPSKVDLPHEGAYFTKDGIHWFKHVTSIEPDESALRASPID